VSPFTSDTVSVGGKGRALLAFAALFMLLLVPSAAAVGPYQLLSSNSSNRSGPTPLDGSTVSGKIYVFTSPDTSDISRVRFYLDNPTATGTPRRTENIAPYDFAGGTTTAATAFDTATIADGSHSITAAVDLTSGTTEVVTATFTVVNNAPSPPALSFSPGSLSFSAEEGGSAPPDQTSSLSTNDGSTPSFALTENAPWLTVSSSSSQTPATVTASVDPSGLAAGTYTAPVTANAGGFTSATLNVSFTVSPAGGGDCVPITCSEVLVDYPYGLGWSGDEGRILDKNGVGTGFTWVVPAPNGTGYVPGNLTVGTTSPGTLKIATTKGIAAGSVNSQDNMLGVGIDSAGRAPILSTTLVNPTAGTGKYQQAGLWYGLDQQNYDKVVVISTSTGTKIQHLLEVNGATQSSRSSGVLNLSSSTVRLRISGNAADRSLKAAYSVNGGSFVNLGTFTAPGEFFNADAAGIDPRIGTRTFGGIFATHRNGGSSLTYTFDNFSLTEASAPPPPPPPPPPPDGGAVSFARVVIPGSDGNSATPDIANPTSLAWGPDDRLYVADMLGTIQALTLNANHQVTARQFITTVGRRLTLGITFDPASTPTNPMLWVAHSDPDLTNNATANSSVISKLTGTNFATKTDVITGLPRAYANHSVNSLHFGPDGRLYIVIGGNTGAGAANTAGTEFKDRPEQPLSAALVVADVKASGFEGQCATAVGQSTIPSTCDVSTYSTGLRNTYDFVFHSNGSLYAPDNGLGVKGSYPPETTHPCKSLGSVLPWDQGGNNPGDQPDVLNRLLPGMYYGHPNPYRVTGGECVFRDGSLYPSPKPAPLSNYKPPTQILGPSKSSDGIVEYRSDVFGSSLKGELLITNYSAGDNITRIKLDASNPDVVTNFATLAVPRLGSETKDFQNPLPIVEGPDGTLYVGEHAVGRISALVPAPSGSAGSWTTRAPMPTAVLDAGGAALGGRLYSIAGKTSAGYLKSMRIYDPVANGWSTGPTLPSAYPAVENPAVVAFNGKLYVFGGSTAAFSGAVTNAAVYDPGTNAWASLASMPVGRGGPTAQALGGKIYVAGGLDGSGVSLASVSVYDPVTNSWSSAPSMGTPRDNPGSAVLTDTDGRQKLYVFGGRTRGGDGTLASVEMYDPTANTWTARAAMPTGRRTMAVGLLNGRAQLMGGERSGTTDGTFPQNEEYNPLTNSWSTLTSMPTPRHGTAYGTIDGVVYVTGGGPKTGTSFTNVNEAFSFG
jgi:large repetitive protein